MAKKERVFNGEIYGYRASFPKEIANNVAKELRARGVLVRITKERERTLGSNWYAVWQRSRL